MLKASLASLVLPVHCLDQVDTVVSAQETIDCIFDKLSLIPRPYGPLFLQAINAWNNLRVAIRLLLGLAVRRDSSTVDPGLQPRGPDGTRLTQSPGSRLPPLST